MSTATATGASAAEAAMVFDAIRGFLFKNASMPGVNEISLDTRLLADGALDSLGILQLTMFLADELRIEVADEDFMPENFETVGNLVQFILRKQGLAA